MQTKALGESFTDIVSAGVSGYNRPCVAFLNGRAASWVDITNFNIDQAYTQQSEYRPDRYLLGLSILQKSGGLYPVGGWKWYMGSIIKGGLILPVPTRPEDLLSGALSFYATWQGRVPAPYGFCVWTHALGSGNYIYVSALIEDEVK